MIPHYVCINPFPSDYGHHSCRPILGVCGAEDFLLHNITKIIDYFRSLIYKVVKLITKYACNPFNAIFIYWCYIKLRKCK